MKNITWLGSRSCHWLPSVTSALSWPMTSPFREDDSCEVGQWTVKIPTNLGICGLTWQKGLCSRS